MLPKSAEMRANESARAIICTSSLHSTTAATTPATSKTTTATTITADEIATMLSSFAEVVIVWSVMTKLGLIACRLRVQSGNDISTTTTTARKGMK